jgi:acetyltransferase-like isoleucine patch superfamily enzyme
LDEATELSRGEPEAVALAAARKSEAADHTWIARVDVLLKELQDVGDRKGKEPTQPLWKPPFHLRLTRAANRYWRLAWMRTMNRRARFGAGCDIRRGSTLVMERNGWVEFGPNCILDRFLTVECVGVLRVGANVIFGHNCTIAARESILIGDDCLIAEMVSIRDHDHRLDRLDVPTRDQGAVCSPVRIGRNVWLGSKVTVLKGVTIGENAVIGANSVVTRDIPANAVAVGAPAKVIRFRTQGGI